MEHKKNYSKEFKDFILALQDWIDNGCVRKSDSEPPFRKKDSVCFQVHHYAYSQGISDSPIRKDLREALNSLTGGVGNTPFNDNESYGIEMEDDEHGHYQNPQRLAWTKMMADTFKAEEEA